MGFGRNLECNALALAGLPHRGLQQEHSGLLFLCASGVFQELGQFLGFLTHRENKETSPSLKRSPPLNWKTKHTSKCCKC